MSKNFKFARLLDIYGGILSSRQLEIMNYYYNDDMSLGEISDIVGISRQGVRDAVKKSETLLETSESQIGAAARIDFIENKINLIKNELICLRQFCDIAANEKIDVLINSLNEIQEQ